MFIMKYQLWLIDISHLNPFLYTLGMASRFVFVSIKYTIL